MSRAVPGMIALNTRRDVSIHIKGRGQHANLYALEKLHATVLLNVLLVDRLEDRAPRAMRAHMRSVRTDNHVRSEHLARFERHGWSLRVRVDVDDVAARAQRCAVLYRRLCENSSEVGVLSASGWG